MLQSIKKICGDKLGASDGEVGHVKDFYFEDKHWAIRYLVADTGHWLPGRRLLISTIAFASLYQSGKLLFVNLTRKQIADSPSMDEHKPISRQYEEEYNRFYGWPDYWYGEGVWGSMGDVPIFSGESQPFLPEHPGANGVTRDQFDPHLRSAKAIIGYQIQVRDESVGQVADFLVDDRNWVIRQWVINTGNRFTGKKVLLTTSQISRISYEESKVFVRMTKEEVLRAPAYEEEPAQLAVAAPAGHRLVTRPIIYGKHIRLKNLRTKLPLMNTRTGLWIDHRKAVIVVVTEDGTETKLISSNVEKQDGRTDGVRSTAPFEPQLVLADNSHERKFHGHLDHYYDAVINAIGQTEEILIFGPGEAKGELKKRMESHHPTARILAVEAEDKMTDHQITAKVLHHFQKADLMQSSPRSARLSQR